MAKCISCGREIPEKEEKIYGVIRKHHYDNRYSTADIDTGPTDFTPVALIRIGVCPDCNRSLGTGKIRAAAGLLLGGVAVTGITLYLSFHLDSEYNGAGVLLGLVMTVFGLIGLIRAAAAKLTAKEQNAPSAVSGMLKPEWIVYPPAEDIFNAFHFTPLPKVRVVILGQDPYHEEGQAHGLCFSVRKGVEAVVSIPMPATSLGSKRGLSFLACSTAS